MKINLNGLKEISSWNKANIVLPKFDIQEMRKNTEEKCRWIHFGSGNIFRGFIAARMQDLLEKQLADTGIVVSAGYDFQVIDEVYAKHDNLSLVCTLKSDKTIDSRIVASVSRACKCSYDFPEDLEALKRYFRNPLLQLVSFTITEKGYVADDSSTGPDDCKSLISFVTSLAYERFKTGAYPLAFVSMDNCSQNGDKLKKGVLKTAEKWESSGFVSKEFLSYLSDSSKVAFPITMIDKITPRPHEQIQKMLQHLGVEDCQLTVTSKKSFIAPFVNTEECEYLVIEDTFPNGRPPLEEAGIFMTDRDTVNKVERMKVCTCLNPIHTAMSIMGCLLGYEKISAEMEDQDIVKYIRRIGYAEGMAVVADPGIINPKSFIDDVFERRLPNPFLPDTPQRIATDTSQKLSVRFGETVKSYINEGKDLDNLAYIPVVYASWLRYLLGVDDFGNTFEISPDPLLDNLKQNLKGLKLGDCGPFDGFIKPILENEIIFGFNVWTSPLKEKVVSAFDSMMKGKGTVREFIHRL